MWSVDLKFCCYISCSWSGFLVFHIISSCPENFRGLHISFSLRSIILFHLSLKMELDEPLTPASRLFLRPEMDQVIHCVMTSSKPFDISLVKEVVSNSILTKHPRFSSLLVRDHRSGSEHWQRTQVDVDRHIIPVYCEADSNDYLADLAVSSPLSTDKPLWEIHLLMVQNTAVFRIHHAMGDGISLMSLLLSCCRKKDDPDALPTMTNTNINAARRRKRSPWELVKMLWFTLIFVLKLMARCLWLSDKRTVVSGGEGVELWPRKVATATFWLKDMKLIKNAIPDATINDVLFGIFSHGLSRYLDLHSSNAMQDGQQLTGLAMVNLREQPGLQEMSKLMDGHSGTRWGNKFGFVLLPVYYHRTGTQPLEYLRKAKTMIDQKKQSLEALMSYKIADFVMSYFGPKVTSTINYRIFCNTTFTISNILGPSEEVTIAGGNPITHIRATSTSLPHALTMHMISYAGRAEMQILVAKDIIPDPDFLAKCFEDALFEMKEAALITATSTNTL